MKYTLKKKFISVLMAIFIVLSFSFSNSYSVVFASEIGDGIESTGTSDGQDTEYSDPDDFTGITEKLDENEVPSENGDTSEADVNSELSGEEDADESENVSDTTEQGNSNKSFENPVDVNQSGAEQTTEAGKETSSVTKDNENEGSKADNLDSHEKSDESEISLHALITEKNSTAEVAVLTSADSSDISVRPTRGTGIEAEEGLEVIKAYLFADREGNSDEELWIKADPNEKLSLEEGETLSLYTIKDNTACDVIVEDISEDSEPYAIDEDVTGVALVKDTGYRHLNLELDASEKKDDASDEEIEVHSITDAELHSGTDAKEKDDDEIQDNVVTLDGMMPKAVSAVAVDVTEKREEEELKEKEEAATTTDADIETSSATDARMIVAAYDISLTDGDSDYQPDEEHPIDVEIFDQRISKNSDLELWHIKDDGEKEQITDFTVEDGKVSFSAFGFSVYEIVEKTMTATDGTGWQKVGDYDTFFERSASGLYIGHSDGYYFKDTTYLVKNGPRTGIEKTKPKNQTNPPEDAVEYYFERIENAAENDETGYSFYVYCLDGNGNKKYLTNKATNNNDKNWLRFTTEDQKMAFTVKLDSTDTFTVVNGGWYWNQQGDEAGNGFASYDQNNKGSKIQFWYYIPLNDDPYGLDGEKFSIMNYSSGAVGNAMIADATNNSVVMLPAVVRSGSTTHTLYVSENDVSIWEFENESEDKYYLSSKVNGNTKYLSVSESGITLVDSKDAASKIKVIPGGGSEKRFRLSVDGKNIILDGSNYRLDSGTNNAWFSFIKPATVETDDLITYSSTKVSVSDVETGDGVIVYTRVWNEQAKRYDFYAVDHNGSLRPCFERGNNIMWVGDQISTMLWEFTEYTYDDGTPNGYYELQNQYSKKYLAPQVQDGQTLSDTTIGINMPGRVDNEYYSDILAWDDLNYAYAGLKADVDNSKVTSCPKAQADTFYFAIPELREPELTTVETISNADFGITMKMYDFTNRNDMKTYMGTDNSDVQLKQGLLSRELVGDYPLTTYRAGGSLGDLFTASGGCTRDYREVDGLFIKSTYEASGYLEFDSCQNFATLKNPDGTLKNTFTVYKELGTSNKDNKSTLKHGQFLPYDTIKAGVYSDKNPQNLYNTSASLDNPNAGKLDENDPRKYEPLHAVSGGADPNYYNGFEMSASFSQTPSGKDAWGHDIIFEFTGDDDFWLYVDGQLVIDLGGIHSALPGEVNFSTGDVEVNGVATNLRAVFEDNYRATHSGASDADVEAFLNQYFEPGENIFKDYSNHKMRIFYMERGGGASNLHMRFNLSYVTPGSVMLTKDVAIPDDAGFDKSDFDLVEYPFQIYYIDPATDKEVLLTNDNQNVNVKYQNSTQRIRYEATYHPPDADESTVFNSVYFLDPQKTAEIHFPINTITYRIVECGVDKDVYYGADVNKIELSPTPVDEESNRVVYDSGQMTVEERPNVVFTNHVNKEGLRPLTFQKKLYDKNKNAIHSNEDETVFSFRLQLTNGADYDLKPANMVKYHVRDEDGNYCEWNAQEQKFVPSSYSSLDGLNIRSTDSDEVKAFKRAEKAKITFETSMNGSISKIPPWYKVEVPNLPVGLMFKVEERFGETPIGYGRIDYEWSKGTYFRVDGEKDNVGIVRPNQSPSLSVTNQRGYGIQANKIWSDKQYTKGHDAIYTAVYIDGETDPVPGTVRRITHPDTYVRYFFEDLEDGKSFEQYKVYEVAVTDPVVTHLDESDGVVSSYSSVEKIDVSNTNNNGFIQIGAITTVGTTYEPFNYSVGYEQGVPEKSVPSLDEANTRKDTITNVRTGGIVISLYDMKDTTKRLPGGEFTLQRIDSATGNYIDEGTFVSDSNGRITILYDFVPDETYVLSEKVAPKGYIGLPNDISFVVDSSNNITINANGNESKWQRGDKFDVNAEQLIAYVDVFNKPYTIQVYKYDGEKIGGNSELSDARFALYRGVPSGFAGLTKDRNPISGYENLVTNDDGLIPAINSQLEPGQYYLEEHTPPDGYIGLSGDVVFEITDKDGLRHISSPADSHVEFIEHSDEDSYTYELRIPNIKSEVDLTVTKTVVGNQGSRDKEFEFTFTVDGESNPEGYFWYKNGVKQSTKILSNGKFYLSHGDSVKIKVPSGIKVTITENPDGYKSEFKVGSGTKQAVNTVTLDPIIANTTIEVTNTRDGFIPTGVWMSYGFMAFAGVAIIAFMLNLRRRRRRLEEELKKMK